MQTRIRELQTYKSLGQDFPIAVLESDPWRSHLLTAIAIAAVGLWFAAIMTDRRFRALLIALAFIATWPLSLASELENFWLSVGFVLSLTLIGAAFILHDMEKGAGENNNRMVLFTASLFLASGLFTLAGWFYPLPYVSRSRITGWSPALSTCDSLHPSSLRRRSSSRVSYRPS